MGNINLEELGGKPVDEIVDMVIRKANIIIMNEVPFRDCIQKELLSKVKREQVKKKVSAVLNPGGMGITITI